MVKFLQNPTPIDYRFIILVSIPAKVAVEYRATAKDEEELAEILLSFSDDFVRQNNIIVLDIVEGQQYPYKR